MVPQEFIAGADWWLLCGQNSWCQHGERVACPSFLLPLGKTLAGASQLHLKLHGMISWAAQLPVPALMVTQSFPWPFLHLILRASINLEQGQTSFPVSDIATLCRTVWVRHCPGMQSPRWAVLGHPPASSRCLGCAVRIFTSSSSHLAQSWLFLKDLPVYFQSTPCL